MGSGTQSLVEKPLAAAIIIGNEVFDPDGGGQLPKLNQYLTSDQGLAQRQRLLQAGGNDRDLRAAIAQAAGVDPDIVYAYRLAHLSEARSQVFERIPGYGLDEKAKTVVSNISYMLGQQLPLMLFSQLGAAAKAVEGARRRCGQRNTAG